MEDVGVPGMYGMGGGREGTYRMDIKSRLRMVFPFGATLTVFMCMFMAWSTPVMVPWTVVPFFNSTWTVSLESFIKNLHARGGG